MRIVFYFSDGTSFEHSVGNFGAANNWVAMVSRQCPKYVRAELKYQGNVVSQFTKS